MYRAHTPKNRADISPLSFTARVKERSVSALYYGSNRMSLLISVFFVMLFLYGTFYIGKTCLSFLALLPDTALPISHKTLSYAVYGALYLFLCPLLSGLLLYAYDLCRASLGEVSGHVPVTEIFSPYASPVYLIRSWIFLSLLLFISAMTVILPHTLFAFLQKVLCDSAAIGAMGISVLSYVLSALVFLCVLYLGVSLSPSLFLALTRPDISPLRAVFVSFLYMQRHITFALHSVISFLVLSLLSLLLWGIPFFLFVLPYAILTYISFSRELSGSISI